MKKFILSAILIVSAVIGMNAQDVALSINAGVGSFFFLLLLLPILCTPLSTVFRYTMILRSPLPQHNTINKTHRTEDHTTELHTQMRGAEAE